MFRSPRRPLKAPSLQPHDEVQLQLMELESRDAAGELFASLAPPVPSSPEPDVNEVETGSVFEQEAWIAFDWEPPLEDELEPRSLASQAGRNPDSSINGDERRTSDSTGRNEEFVSFGPDPFATDWAEFGVESPANSVDAEADVDSLTTVTETLPIGIVVAVGSVSAVMLACTASPAGTVAEVMTGSAGPALLASGDPEPPINHNPLAVEDTTTEAGYAVLANVGNDGNNTLTVMGYDGVLWNDTDENGDKLTAELKFGPSHGSLTLYGDGGFTYTPQMGFEGDDRFWYTAFDGKSHSAVTYVDIMVMGPHIFLPEPPDQLQNNLPVVIGEEILLTGSFFSQSGSPRTLKTSGHKWTIDGADTGAAIAGVEFSKDVKTEVHWQKIKPLTADDLDDDKVSFFFVKGAFEGEDRTVKYKIEADNTNKAGALIGGKWSANASKNVRVFAPEGKSERIEYTTDVGRVTVGPRWDYEQGDTLTFGKSKSNTTLSPGITAVLNGKLPPVPPGFTPDRDTFGGSLAIYQVVTTTVKVAKGDGKFYQFGDGKTRYIDAGYDHSHYATTIWPFDHKVGEYEQSKFFVVDDSPSVTLDQSMVRVSRSDEFTSYLMYAPTKALFPGSDRIMVAIGKYQWNWNGEAENQIVSKENRQWVRLNGNGGGDTALTKWQGIPEWEASIRKAQFDETPPGIHWNPTGKWW